MHKQVASKSIARPFYTQQFKSSFFKGTFLKVSWATYDNLNPRKTMEDRVQTSSFKWWGIPCDLATLYDGHGGAWYVDRFRVAFSRAMETGLPQKMEKTTFKQMNSIGQHAAIIKFIQNLVLKVDASLKEEALRRKNTSGTTFLMAFWMEGIGLFIGNLGDSHAITLDDAQRLTQDHNVKSKEAVADLEKRGGVLKQIDGKGPFRTEGSLLLTAALGNFHINEGILLKTVPIKSYLPDSAFVTFFSSGKYPFIFSSDGILDVLSPTELGSLAVKAKTTSEFLELATKAALERGATDNFSMMAFYTEKSQKDLDTSRSMDTSEDEAYSALVRSDTKPLNQET